MMKLKDLKIDAKATLGRRIVLTNIAPKYVYEGGKKTDKVEGCYYTVFCQDRQYMTLRVSVPGDARIDDATVDKMPHVEFEGLDVSTRLFLPEDMLETQGKGQIMVMPLSELREKNIKED